MHAYIEPIYRQFLEAADEKKAAAARAYMRDQFDFFGVPMPLRRQLCKTYMKQSLPALRQLSPICRELWSLPERECQYFAIELVMSFRKQWEEDFIRLFEWMIIHKSWWDTVDYIAAALTGPYFTMFPEKIKKVTGAWNRSDDVWLQRSSLLFQNKYKKQTDIELLSAYVRRLAGSKAFFVQKAIGWTLREYSKTNPGWVARFVREQPLAAVSKKEALKRMKK